MDSRVSELFLPGFWGKGYTPSLVPSDTSDSARRGEILNVRQRRVGTVFKRRKVALFSFLDYSQHLFVGDCKEKWVFWAQTFETVGHSSLIHQSTGSQMAVSWSLLSYTELPSCSKNSALKSSAALASWHSRADRARQCSGAPRAAGAGGDVPVPSGGPAVGVELRPDSAGLSPSAQQGMSPVAAALQLRGLALAGRGWETSAPSPRGCPAATAASLRSPGLISALLRADLCAPQGWCLHLEPAFTMAQLPPCGCTGLFISCCRQRHSNRGVLREKGFCLFTLFLCITKISPAALNSPGITGERLEWLCSQ